MVSVEATLVSVSDTNWNAGVIAKPDIKEVAGNFTDVKDIHQNTIGVYPFRFRSRPVYRSVDFKDRDWEVPFFIIAKGGTSPLSDLNTMLDELENCLETENIAEARVYENITFSFINKSDKNQIQNDSKGWGEGVFYVSEHSSIDRS